MATTAARNAAFDVVRADLDAAGIGQKASAADVLHVVDLALSAGTRAAAFPLVRAFVNAKAGFFAFLIHDDKIRAVIDQAYAAAEAAKA